MTELAHEALPWRAAGEFGVRFGAQQVGEAGELALFFAGPGVQAGEQPAGGPVALPGVVERARDPLGNLVVFVVVKGLEIVPVIGLDHRVFQRQAPLELRPQAGVVELLEVDVEAGVELRLVARLGLAPAAHDGVEAGAVEMRPGLRFHLDVVVAIDQFTFPLGKLEQSRQVHRHDQRFLRGETVTYARPDTGQPAALCLGYLERGRRAGGQRPQL